MNTIKKIIGTIILTTAIIGSVFANGITYRLTAVAGEKSAILLLKDVEGKEVRLLVTDKLNNIVISQSFVGQAEVFTELSFETLEKGSYKVILQFENSQIERALEITDSQSILMTEHTVKSRKIPYELHLTKKQLRLNFDENSGHIISVKIQNQSGKEVYQSKFVNSFKSTKDIDISKFKDGVYQVEIKEGTRTVIQHIVL